MQGYRFVILIVVILFTQNCIPRKPYIYLQDKSSLDTTTIPIIKKEYQLQPGDQLIIELKGMNEQVSSYFETKSSLGPMGGINPGSLYLMSYIIDDTGTIMLPVLGKVQVAGYTIDSLRRTLNYKLKDYLVGENSFSIKMVNYRVFVLGEVRNPGVIPVYDDYMTVLQAISVSGDLTDFGNREKIRLYRKTKTGTKVYTINFSDLSLLGREEFVLLPEDVIYVEPVPAKKIRANFQVISLVLGGISATILAISFILNNTN